jgi:hypothetical protein
MDPGFGPNGLLDVLPHVPRGLLDISGFDADIRRSAAESVRNPTLPALPEIAPLRETNYDGLRKAFDVTGKALDGQNAATTGLLVGRAIKKPSTLPQVAQTAKALDDIFFKWAGRILTPAEEAAGAAADMQKGVPAHVAIPGAALRTGSRFLAGAASGAATGAAVGLVFPPAAPIGAVLGGLAGGFAAGEFLPSREAFGRGLLNSFKAYGKDPFYGMP